MAPKKVPKPADLIVLGQQQPAGDALAGRPAAPTTPPILASGAVAPPAAKRARHGEAPASASQPTPTPSALQDALVDPVVANLVDEVLATSSEERAAQVVLAALQTVQTAYGSSGAAATAVQQRVTFVFVGILALVKKRPRLMRAASVVQAMVNVLRTGKAAPVAVLVSNLLLVAFDEVKVWPEEFAVAYLEDAAGERVWVDLPDCAKFVDNLLTAFPGASSLDRAAASATAATTKSTLKLPTTSLLQKRALLQQHRSGGNDSDEGGYSSSSSLPPRPSSGASQMDVDSGDEHAPTAAPAQDYLAYRFADGDVQQRIRQHAVRIVHDLAKKTTITDVLHKNLLRLLLVTSSFSETLPIGVSRLDGWLQNGAVTKTARELRVRIVRNCLTMNPSDQETLRLFLAMRPIRVTVQGGSSAGGEGGGDEQIELLTQLLRNNEEYPVFAMYHVIMGEFQAAKATAPSSTTSSSSSSSSSASSASAAASKRPISAHTIRQLAVIVNQNPTQTCAYMGQLMQNVMAASAHLLPVAVTLLDRAVTSASFDIVAFIEGLLNLASSTSSPVGANLLPWLDGVKQLHTSAMNALTAQQRIDELARRHLWHRVERAVIVFLHHLTRAPPSRDQALPVVPTIFGTVPVADFVSFTRRMLALEVNMEPLAKREGLDDAFVDDVILRCILELPLPKTIVLALLEGVVRRGCNAVATKPANVSAPSFGNAAAAIIRDVFLLSVITPTDAVQPQPPLTKTFCESSLFWKAVVVLSMLAAISPDAFGATLWSGYPTVQSMMAMMVTRIFNAAIVASFFPHSDPTEAQLVREETDALAFFASRAIEDQFKVMVFEPHNLRRTPSDTVISVLEKATLLFKLTPLLCSCRNPDYLEQLSSISASLEGPASNWLAPMISADPAMLEFLPVASLYPLALDMVERGMSATERGLVSSEASLQRIVGRIRTDLFRPDPRLLTTTLRGLATAHLSRRIASESLLGMIAETPSGHSWLSRFQQDSQLLAVVLPSLLHALNYESRVPVCARYVNAIGQSTELLDGSTHVDPLCSLPRERPLLVSALLPAAKDAWIAIIQWANKISPQHALQLALDLERSNDNDAVFPFVAIVQADQSLLAAFAQASVEKAKRLVLSGRSELVDLGLSHLNGAHQFDLLSDAALWSRPASIRDAIIPRLTASLDKSGAYASQNLSPRNATVLSQRLQPFSQHSHLFAWLQSLLPPSPPPPAAHEQPPPLDDNEQMDVAAAPIQSLHGQTTSLAAKIAALQERSKSAKATSFILLDVCGGGTQGPRHHARTQRQQQQPPLEGSSESAMYRSLGHFVLGQPQWYAHVPFGSPIVQDALVRLVVKPVQATAALKSASSTAPSHAWKWVAPWLVAGSSWDELGELLGRVLSSAKGATAAAATDKWTPSQLLDVVTAMARHPRGLLPLTASFTSATTLAERSGWLQQLLTNRDTSPLATLASLVLAETADLWPRHDSRSASSSSSSSATTTAVTRTVRQRLNLLAHIASNRPDLHAVVRTVWLSSSTNDVAKRLCDEWDALTALNAPPHLTDRPHALSSLHEFVTALCLDTSDRRVNALAAYTALRRLTVQRPGMVASYLPAMASLTDGTTEVTIVEFVKRNYHTLFFQLVGLLEVCPPAILLQQPLCEPAFQQLLERFIDLLGMLFRYAQQQQEQILLLQQQQQQQQQHHHHNAPSVTVPLRLFSPLVNRICQLVAMYINEKPSSALAFLTVEHVQTLVNLHPFMPDVAHLHRLVLNVTGSAAFSGAAVVSASLDSEGLGEHIERTRESLMLPLAPPKPQEPLFLGGFAPAAHDRQSTFEMTLQDIDRVSLHVPSLLAKFVSTLLLLVETGVPPEEQLTIDHRKQIWKLLHRHALNQPDAAAADIIPSLLRCLHSAHAGMTTAAQDVAADLVMFCTTGQAKQVVRALFHSKPVNTLALRQVVDRIVVTNTALLDA